MTIYWPWKISLEDHLLRDILNAIHHEAEKVKIYHDQIGPGDVRGILDFLEVHRADVVYLSGETHVAAAIVARIPCYWAIGDLQGNLLGLMGYSDSGQAKQIRQLWPSEASLVWQPRTLFACH